MKILAIFTHPHIFLNLHEFLFLLWNTKDEFMKNTPATLFSTKEVNWKCIINV